jgi:hypothetical protein
MSDSGNPDPITDLILLKFFSSAREDEKLLFLIYYKINSAPNTLTPCKSFFNFWFLIVLLYSREKVGIKRISSEGLSLGFTLISNVNMLHCPN